LLIVLQHYSETVESFLDIYGTEDLIIAGLTSWILYSCRNFKLSAYAYTIYTWFFCM